MNSISFESLLPSVLTLAAALAGLWLLFWLLRRWLKRQSAQAGDHDEGDGRIDAARHWAERLNRWLGRLL